MSTATQTDRDELAKDKALKAAIEKALDFSEAYAAIERAEKIIEDLNKTIKKESSQ